MGTIRQRKDRLGKTVFDAEVRHKGFPMAYRTFFRLTDARFWVQDIEANMRAGRVRYLSDNERERLLEACKHSESPNLYPLVVLTLSTGMRRGDVRRYLVDKMAMGIQSYAAIFFA